MVLLIDNQFARLEPIDIKIKSTDQQPTDSQSESSTENIDVESPNSSKKLQ